MKKILPCFLLHMCLILIVTGQGKAGGLIGDAVEGLCGGCGAGKKLDEKHDEVKKEVPVYGNAEEATSKTVQQTAEETKKLSEKALKETGNAINDTVKTLTTGKAHGDIAETFEKAVNDTFQEANRAGRNINDAAIAAGNFLENQTQSYGVMLSDAERRLREGKLVDAIWHIGTDPLKHSERNFGKAVTESSLLNDVATATASVYGGAAGAAAYAAWLTYNRTGDLNLALKAGVIAGATSQGLKVVNGMPIGTTEEFVKKTLASASIGGAAVAASGGGERQIIEAFVKGAAITVAREHYKSRTNQEIEGKAPTKPAIAKLDREGGPNQNMKYKFTVLTDGKGTPIKDAYGNMQVDIRSLPRDISHVGLATADLEAGFGSGAETSMPMQGIAKIPYMNDMAYYHDQWMAVSQAQGIEVQATILPALILTVSGSETPVIDQATDIAIKTKAKNP